MTQWKINFSVRRQRVTGSAVGRTVETLAFHHSNHLGEHCARLLLTLKILRSLRIQWFLPQKGVPKKALVRANGAIRGLHFYWSPTFHWGFRTKM